MVRLRSEIYLLVGLFFSVLMLGWLFAQQNDRFGQYIDQIKFKFNSIVGDVCTRDYINNNPLPQDHPCIIQIIRNEFLVHPPAPEVPLNLSNPEITDPSVGQAAKILNVLNNKTKGFFIECGALEGEWLSNTLYMERYLGWTGLLIEAIPKHFQKLTAKHRKAWTLPACVSLGPYPVLSQFVAHSILGHGSIKDDGRNDSNQEIVQVQCFPLYSILLAVERTTIDFFSLDVEGHELMVLKTIPWHKVDIQTLTVEWVLIKEGKQSLISYMNSIGYDVVSELAHYLAEDVMFTKRNSTNVAKA